MISVVIVNWNGMKYLRNCLESLYLSEQDKEIIVVDNGSTDGSRDFLMKGHILEGKIRCVFLPRNKGLAYASNKGAKYAKGEYIFFLNNDTIVNKYIFTHLIRNVKEETGILGCRMFDYKGEKQLDANISLDRFGYPCGKNGHIFYPDGAIFIKRKVFEQIGGFDEKLFLYGEDRDLAWRVWLGGWRVDYCPSAHFYHDSRSVCATNYYRRRKNESNTIRSIIKNYSLGSLFFIIPQYMFWSILEIGFMLFCNPKAILLSYIPAYWWNLINIRDTLIKRTQVQKTRKIKDRDIPFSRVIGKLWVLKKMGVPKWEKS